MREREGLALVEGPGVIGEALRSSVDVRWVIVGEEYGTRERGRAIATACRERGVEVVYAGDREVGDLCTTDAPRPVLACVRPPPLESRPVDRGRYLMALGVQVPGNLGTLVRSAWAFGLDGVVIGTGTVDPWNAKVVRASAGAVFHLPLIEAPAGLGGGGDGASGEGAARLSLLCADSAGVPVEAVAESCARDWVLVVGNEGSGIESPVASLGRAVAVPLADGVDSLNVGVAGSILMYELTRPGEGRGLGGRQCAAGVGAGRATARLPRRIRRSANLVKTAGAPIERLGGGGGGRVGRVRGVVPQRLRGQVAGWRIRMVPSVAVRQLRSPGAMVSEHPGHQLPRAIGPLCRMQRSSDRPVPPGRTGGGPDLGRDGRAVGRRRGGGAR